MKKAMEELVKHELGTTLLKSEGRSGGGCISDGNTYVTDHGKVFIKVNRKNGARLMFDGEFASLEAIIATNTVRVPKPIKVLDDPGGGWIFIMENLDMHGLSGTSAGRLGELMARLHMHNEEMGKLVEKDSGSVHQQTHSNPQHIDKFGFHTPTCCGFIPQDNTWQMDWVKFYAQKMDVQMKLIEKDYGDREALDLWSHLLKKLPNFFKGIEVKPALLHGDLWGGNAGQTADEPVVYDPASFYGHSEYELAISMMFGGYGHAFFDAYHRLLPKQPGFEARHELYKMFHYANHWNHFGTGYRGSTISIMKNLTR